MTPEPSGVAETLAHLVQIPGQAGELGLLGETSLEALSEIRLETGHFLSYYRLQRPCFQEQTGSLPPLGERFGDASVGERVAHVKAITKVDAYDAGSDQNAETPDAADTIAKAMRSSRQGTMSSRRPKAQPNNSKLRISVRLADLTLAPSHKVARFQQLLQVPFALGCNVISLLGWGIALDVDV